MNGHTVAERLDRYCSPEPMSGCWLWAGSVNQGGYGQLRVAGRLVLAHRLSFERHRGAIPRGLVIDHKCRNTACINPHHMEAVTQGENIRRGRGGMCRSGLHAMVGANVYQGGRDRLCRACLGAYRATHPEHFPTWKAIREPQRSRL